MSLYSWQPHIWPAGALHLPPIQVHRGYCGQGARENTLAAFRAARQLGFEMVELDVRLSRDHVAVVVHDADLQRICGRSQRVLDLSAAELWQIAEIPTLEQALTDSEAPLKFNIEIKDDPQTRGRIETVVAEIVQKSRFEHRILFSSFNPFRLRRMWQLCPEIPRGYLLTQHRRWNPIWLVRFTGAHLLHLDSKIASEEFLLKLRTRQIPFAVWTVNDTASAKRFCGAGAVSLITDRPDKINLI